MNDWDIHGARLLVLKKTCCVTNFRSRKPGQPPRLIVTAPLDLDFGDAESLALQARDMLLKAAADSKARDMLLQAAADSAKKRKANKAILQQDKDASSSSSRRWRLI